MKWSLFLLWLLMALGSHAQICETADSLIKKQQWQTAQNWLLGQTNYADNPCYFKSLGLTYLMEGNAKLSIQSYQQAFRLDPQCLPCAVNTARGYFIQNQIDSMNFWIEKAQRIQPDHPEIHLFLASTRKLPAQRLLAEMDYQKAIGNGYVPALTARGNYYLSMGLETLAKKDAERALSLDSMSGLAWELFLQTIYAEADTQHLDALLPKTLQKFPDRGALVILAAHRAFQKNEDHKADSLFKIAWSYPSQKVSALAGELALFEKNMQFSKICAWRDSLTVIQKWSPETYTKFEKNTRKYCLPESEGYYIAWASSYFIHGETEKGFQYLYNGLNAIQKSTLLQIVLIKNTFEYKSLVTADSLLNTLSTNISQSDSALWSNAMRRWNDDFPLIPSIPFSDYLQNIYYYKWKVELKKKTQWEDLDPLLRQCASRAKDKIQKSYIYANAAIEYHSKGWTKAANSMLLAAMTLYPDLPCLPWLHMQLALGKRGPYQLLLSPMNDQWSFTVKWTANDSYHIKIKKDEQSLLHRHALALRKATDFHEEAWMLSGFIEFATEKGTYCETFKEALHTGKLMPPKVFIKNCKSN